MRILQVLEGVMLKCSELSSEQVFAGALPGGDLGGLAPLLKERGMTFTV